MKENCVTAIIENHHCTGCRACAANCGVHAISMQQDAYGFILPRVDPARCVSCGRCLQVCPAHQKPEEARPLQYWYGWNKNEAIRPKSTSGGIFWALAQQVLQADGVVFGAVLDVETGRVFHQSTQHVPVERLLKSKYVQSDLGDSFAEIAQLLHQNRTVLFCGTPCQVYGLKACKLEHPEKLITVDFICHGVPSQKLFKDYLKSYNGKITAFDFRSKTPGGWLHGTISYEKNGRFHSRKHVLDPYMTFFADDGLNPACTGCPFVHTHAADIILADFWGYASIEKQADQVGKGLSLCMANSEKGKEIVQDLQSTCTLKKIDYAQVEYAYTNMKKRSWQKAVEFYEYYKKNGYQSTVKKYADHLLFRVCLEKIKQKLD